jgi:hypothetical protein
MDVASSAVENRGVLACCRYAGRNYPEAIRLA